MKQEMAMSIIPRLYTHPPSRPRKGLYTARSGTVRLPLQSAGYCDTPPVLRLSPSHSLFLSSPKPSPPLLHPQPLPRFCSSLSSSPPLRVLLSPLPPLPLSRQHERRAACIPGHPFLEQTACPLFPHVRTPRRENYLRFHLSFLPAPPSPACLFFFLPSFLSLSSLMGANE